MASEIHFMKKLVIDTETSGLRPFHHQILTVGMVLADITPKRVKVLDERHLFVKHEEYQLSKTAMRINGIDLEEHHQIGVFPKIACKRIDNFLLEHDLFDTPTLGHNVHFDINFLNAMFEEEKKKYPFCCQKEDTRYIWEGLKRKGLINPVKNAKLGTLAEHFDIDYSDAHDALADCYITAKVYQKLLPLI